MKFVIALIALFAASAMAQTTFAVTSIYSNDNCTALVGQYVNADTSGCTANVTVCTQFGAGSGHFYLQDCAAASVPTFSSYWVVASLWDAGCTAAGAWLAGMPDTCFIFTNNPAAPTAFLAANLGSCSSNTSSIVNVASTDGANAVSATTCTTSPLISNFNNTYTCAASGITGFNFALTQCQETEAAPTAEPTAVPTTATPTAPTAPTTPTHPTAAPKASSAAALAASGLLSVVALLL